MFPTIYSIEELYQAYAKFEEEKVQKANRLLGRNDIKPDSFGKFVAGRTNICPHKIISENSHYWLETINMLDGEMGLSVPSNLEALPNCFFEALAVVRNAKANVQKEEESKKAK